MRVWPIGLFTITGVLLMSARPVHAQGRYRVVVRLANSSKVAVVDFRPCVPAETSDCGVSLDRIVEASDESVGGSPPVLRRATLVGGDASVAIENGRVLITTLTGSTGGRVIVATGLHGDAVALIPGPDPETVFVVSTGATASDRAEVCMIDLRFDGVVARLALDGTPAGIAMARR